VTIARAKSPTDRLARLFDAHHERLYRLARRLAADAEEARDLVQETFLRAARRPTSVPGGEPGGEAWLVRVLVNLCRDRFRRREVRDQGRPFLPRPAAQPSPEAAAVARASVSAALAELPARRRAVVVLAELEGLSSAAIARLLRVAQVTVRWHLSAGRKELAQRLLGPAGGPAAPAAEEVETP
jgi:RNA polymerase sigma-70 factor (ECF subfamily)